MQTYSTLVGVVVGQEPVLQYTQDKEKFYVIDMEFKDVRVPVLYSEYNAPTCLNKTLKVNGNLMSDIKGGVPKCYFYAFSFEVAEADAETTNVVTVTAYVNRVGSLKPTKKLKEQLPITLKSRFILGGRSLIYLVLTGNLARKYQDIPCQTKVTATGELATYRDILEIIVSDISVAGNRKQKSVEDEKEW